LGRKSRKNSRYSSFVFVPRQTKNGILEKVPKILPGEKFFGCQRRGEQKKAAEGHSKMLVRLGLPPAVRCKKGRKKTFRAGAKTELIRELPTLKCRNARSVFENGEMITDTIGAWVTAKIVAGPFAKPPF
jgi:hypothetical protein